MKKDRLPTTLAMRVYRKILIGLIISSTFHLLSSIGKRSKLRLSDTKPRSLLKHPLNSTHVCEAKCTSEKSLTGLSINTKPPFGEKLICINIVNAVYYFRIMMRKLNGGNI